MGVYLWTDRASEYQAVEWIGSSRTQVINTGVIPTTQTYTAELEFESTQNGTEYWAFGIWGTTGFRAGQGSSGSWDTSYGASYSPSTYALNTKTKANVSNSGKGTSTNTALGLFGMGENGAYANNRKGAYKIYYCKIWNNSVLIRDFIPCYRKSDNEIGMYDLVNNQFYTNSGTGTFTKGDDVSYSGALEKELKNAYIGEYKETTETFRFSNSSGVNLYKEGYKIKEVQIQRTVYTTATGWGVTPSRGLYKSSNALDVMTMFRLASQWHYSSYVDKGYGMVGGWRNNAGTGSGDTLLCAYLSNSTTENGGSVIATINEDGGTLKTGTTFGTWVQDTTFTTTTAWETRINDIFTSDDVEIVLNPASCTITNDLMTVTREPVS